ncbi:hypothetical protein LXD69_16850 [Flavobacterium sediminilitoris]|uniref:Solute-binding protein family 5 domain-containing protein n=1 Tax=Flavobacterium sediminilitoris TaxID=2024526 RepID=A0ABY4HLG0_9FLAO|nr:MULTISPECIES: hypothetical protein [Flavobacterium]UOX33689.1 hypothetical protein LXD69_16850 [Flavobacterium sediminilitoris]
MKKMKSLVATILLLLFGINSFSQNTEFSKSNNGLIYSDNTVKQLKFIVDSLNLKFKVCEFDKIYLSKPQAKAHYVSLEDTLVKEAKKDIEANISFDDFIKKYIQTEVDKDLVIIKFKYKNYKKKEVVELSSLEFNDNHGYEFNFYENLEIYDESLKGKWVFRYHEKSEYSKESIDAFYFTEDFTQQPIPERYARMIQYSDCMVDTTAHVFYEKAEKGGVRFSNKEPLKSKNFIDYINKATNRPEYNTEFNEESYQIFSEKYKLWDSLRLKRVDSLRVIDEKFDVLLGKAVQEVLKKGGSNDELEEYVALYYSPKTALELKRNRIVIGGCSQDNSPRIHAVNIAKLAAETINWEIFLRSHLDIMNDRFDRVSDGSYAWGRRKTYIKELEVLDINVLDLLLGISLRVENPSKNHYYGSIGRIGRALSETEKANEIETKMLEMIVDNQLDDYNRILMYYLFLNYNHNLENEEKQTVNKKKLIEAVNKLPEYLVTKIVEE